MALSDVSYWRQNQTFLTMAWLWPDTCSSLITNALRFCLHLLFGKERAITSEQIGFFIEQDRVFRYQLE